MQTEERGFYNTIIACLCIICVFHIIAVALNVYRGWRLIGPTDALYFAPRLIAMWFYLQSQDPHIFDEDFNVSRQQWTLGSWALGLVIWVCYTGKWLGVWDQVTFVDGELMTGMEYTFVWQH